MQSYRFTFLVLLALFAFANQSDAQQLSREGETRKSIHDFLFDDFAKQRKTVYRGEGRDRGLKELTVLTETKQIRHGDEIVVPRGAEKIAVLFRHLGFHGNHLDRISELRISPFMPDKAPPRSVQVKDFYRVQMPSLPLTDEPFAQMKIQFLMKSPDDVCQIDDLVFVAQKAIPPKFDDIPFRDLGSELPRERVEVRVDTDHALVVGGTSDLQRERWFRTHTTPGLVHSSFEKWAAERGFLPARGFLKFNPALTKGWGANPETLKETRRQTWCRGPHFFRSIRCRRTTS